MDSQKILHYWHVAGAAVTGLGIIANEAAPIAKAFPKAAPIVAGIGMISFFCTSVMVKVADDKVIMAVINDPNSPTPQGLGIPKPTNPEVIKQLEVKP